MPILDGVGYEIDQLILARVGDCPDALDNFEETRRFAIFYVTTIHYYLQRVFISGSLYSGGVTSRMLALEILRACEPIPDQAPVIGSAFLRHLMALDYIQSLDEDKLVLFDRAWGIQSSRGVLHGTTLAQTQALRRALSGL